MIHILLRVCFKEDPSKTTLKASNRPWPSSSFSQPQRTAQAGGGGALAPWARRAQHRLREEREDDGGRRGGGVGVGEVGIG